MRIKLDSPFLLGDIKEILKCSLLPNKLLDSRITHICTDSRICDYGDLFFAIKGKNFDGNQFVKEALSKGCIVIADDSEYAHIRVHNTVSTLLSLASFYKSKISNIKATIAITGSVGKTSTKEFLKKLLLPNAYVHANIGNYNNAIGLAHTIFSMPSKTEYLICELGMNHLGEISEMSQCIHPDIAIITNIGTSHIGNLGSRETIAKAKTEITNGIDNGICLVPYNEPLLDGIPCVMKVGTNSHTSLSDFTLCKNAFEEYDYIYPGGSIRNIHINLSQEHLLMNVAMAIAASLILNFDSHTIRNNLMTIKEDDLRQRFIRMPGYTIFDDSYNASYESVIADLKYLCKNFSGRAIGAFIGDIAELGDLSNDIHTQIGAAAAQLKISSLYLIGKYSKYTAIGALNNGFDKSRIFLNEDLENPELSINQINDNHIDNEIILFKGSHSSEIYKIADFLSKNERNQND